MDDPWGSPWADEVQLPKSIKLEDKGDEEGVKNRPATPARVATLVLQEKTNSPWGDAEDDGFGEWASLPADNGRGLGLDGQTDDWEDDTPAAATTTNPAPNALSLDWNESQENEVDQTVKLAPSPFLKARDLARLPSPDPWATSFTTDNETAHSAQEEAEEADQHDFKDKEEESQNNISATNSNPEPLSDELLPDGKDTAPQEASVIHGKIDMEPEAGDRITSSEVIDVAPTAENLDGDHLSSRPSSSPSEHSLHDGMSQESPRTSFDEEPKRPQMPRKTSSKVQELVEHFDGLAKQEIPDTAASSTSSGQETIKAADEPGVEDEDDDDFGDFEEGQSDDEQDTADQRPRTPEIQDQVNTDSRPREGPTSPQPSPKKFMGPVDFNIDTSILEKFYPDLEADGPFEEVFVPDTVPHDSFSTIEERKTWYRVSRYGTMRKYNTGDDNYVRINWPQSQIRKDTLEIVARWMEEDRISGRVVLGGASKGSSIFGWNDKKAAPVPLAHAFAAKEGKRKVEAVVEKVPEIPREWPQDLTRKSSTSKGSPSRTTRRSSVKPSESLAETKSAVEMPVANFGWNTAPQKSQSLDNKPPSSHKSTGSMPKNKIQPNKVASPTPLSPSVKQPSAGNITVANPSALQTPLNIATLAQSTSSVTQPHTELAILHTSEVANEDDDWGEMVASPVMNVQSHPLPEQLPPQRNTTTSLAKIPMTMNAISMQPVASHPSTPSFDDILKPHPTSSILLGPPAETSIVEALSSSAANGNVNHAKLPSVGPATVAADPWAMADFSFFETTPVSAPALAPATATKRTVPSVAKPISKSVSSSGSPLAPPRGDRKSREEVEQDRIVQSVVKSLPDLSYMLRR